MHRRKREKNPLCSKRLTINFAGEAIFKAGITLDVLTCVCSVENTYGTLISGAGTPETWGCPALPCSLPAASTIRMCSTWGKIPFQPQKASVLHKAEVAGGCAQPVTGHHICRIKVWCSKTQLQGTPRTGCAAYPFPYKRGLCGLIFLPGTPRGS